jgi:alpha/beta superfamily hydrolase
VLRFDSRGVGESGGKRTWMRDAEREDCEAAVRRVAKTRGVDKNRVYAIGYGLGAAVALEASKREPSARGFVGISYPFGAKSMLVPCAVGEKAFSLENVSPSKKPRLFAVAGNDCVGAAGDCDAVAASVRKLPPPRRVVVVDDADHAWCGFYETLTTHVLEFMEEHAETLRAEKKGRRTSLCRRRPRRKPPTARIDVGTRRTNPSWNPERVSPARVCRRALPWRILARA